MKVDGWQAVLINQGLQAVVAVIIAWIQKNDPEGLAELINKINHPGLPEHNEDN